MKRLLNAFGLGFFCGMVLMLLVSESFSVRVQVAQRREQPPASITVVRNK